MKNLSIFLAVVVAAISVSTAVYYYQQAEQIRTEIEEERYTRMVTEEQLQEATSKVESLNAELKRTQSKIDVVEKINNDLKARLNNAAKIKEDLEAKIKELLAISS